MIAALTDLEKRLQGWPDELLTGGLVTAGLALIVLGVLAPTLVKALALAWVVFP